MRLEELQERIVLDASHAGFSYRVDNNLDLWAAAVNTRDILSQLFCSRMAKGETFVGAGKYFLDSATSTGYPALYKLSPQLAVGNSSFNDLSVYSSRLHSST